MRTNKTFNDVLAKSIAQVIVDNMPMDFKTFQSRVAYYVMEALYKKTGNKERVPDLMGYSPSHFRSIMAVWRKKHGWKSATKSN